MPAPAAALPLSDEERAVLERLARSTSARHRTVQQAQALLLAADGVANSEIGRRVGVSANSVRTWRARFAEKGLANFGKIARGRGRRSWLEPGRSRRSCTTGCTPGPMTARRTGRHAPWPPATASARTPSPASGGTTT